MVKLRPLAVLSGFASNLQVLTLIEPTSGQGKTRYRHLPRFAPATKIKREL
jgi:hypothetical protein